MQGLAASTAFNFSVDKLLLLQLLSSDVLDPTLFAFPLAYVAINSSQSARHQQHTVEHCVGRHQQFSVGPVTIGQLQQLSQQFVSVRCCDRRPSWRMWSG